MTGMTRMSLLQDGAPLFSNLWPANCSLETIRSAVPQLSVPNCLCGCSQSPISFVSPPSDFKAFFECHHAPSVQQLLFGWVTLNHRRAPSSYCNIRPLQFLHSFTECSLFIWTGILSCCIRWSDRPRTSMLHKVTHVHTARAEPRDHHLVRVLFDCVTCVLNLVELTAPTSVLQPTDPASTQRRLTDVNTCLTAAGWSSIWVRTTLTHTKRLSTLFPLKQS